MGTAPRLSRKAPRRSGHLAGLVLLLVTASACGAMVVFLYTQLREAEAAGARARARSAELEHSAQALGAKVEGLERREQGLTQLLDDLGSRQRTRDAAAAERTSTYEALGTLLQPLLKRGDASLREEPDAVDVHLTERALFVTGTPRLTLNGARLLRQMASGLVDSPWRVDVLGRGPSLLSGPLEVAAERARLAAARAAVVSGYLVRHVGLPAERVSAAVYGPVRRRPSQPSVALRSAIELHLLAPVVDVDRPAAATASSAALPSARP
jgi:flagellar motor protein MotB